MVQVVINDHKVFECTLGTSILKAASEQKITLPYSCKTGRCNTCKCKVLTGQTEALIDEVGLSTIEKAEGWILTCARTAISNLVIEVEDLSDLKLPEILTIPARIDSLIKVTSDVLCVTLRVPSNAVFNYLAGQYIDVIAEGGTRRSYSVANAPKADKKLELHIRAVSGGIMSDYWFNRCKINDLVRLKGPMGSFFLRDTADLDLVFLATGTGIAPVKAMLESMVALDVSERPRSVTVLWGVRNAKDFYLDVDALPGGHHFLPVLSRPCADWEGPRGYVQQNLIETLPDLSQAVVYACGSNAMIHSAKDMLLQAGLLNNRFFSDAFLCSGPQEKTES